MSNRSDPQYRIPSPERLETPPVRSPYEDGRGGFLGWSALFTDESHVRADLKILRRAIQGDWKIPPDTRNSLLVRVVNLLSHPNSRVSHSAEAALSELRDANRRRFLGDAVSEGTDM